jgi:hypothetical protein
MPVLFEIKDKQYSYPQGWQDVTLSRWLESVDKLEKPEVLKQLHAIGDADKRRAFVEAEITEQVYGLEIIPYFLKYFCFWSNVPENVAARISVEQLEQVYQQIETNLNRSLKNCELYEPQIEFKGQVWYLPSQHLQGATVNEFIEASQAEHIAKQVSGNQLKALPKLLAIFLKKTKGAAYNPKQLEREKYFLEMPMDKVFKVSFFLSRLNEKLVRDFHTYMVLSHLSQLRHKGAQA